MKGTSQPRTDGLDAVCEYLLREKLVTDADIQNARGMQGAAGESLAKILLNNGRITRDDMNRALAAAHGVAFSG